MNKHRMLGLTLAVATLVGSACARDDDASTMAGDGSALTDGEILHVLVTVHRAEIDAAQIASQRGQREPVRGFAQRMQSEHTAAIGQIEALARESNLTLAQSDLSREVEEAGRREGQRLRDASAEDFDEAYVDSQVDGHERVLALIDDRLLPSARNERVRQEVGTQRRTVASHHEHARGVKNALDDAPDSEQHAQDGDDH